MMLRRSATAAAVVAAMALGACEKPLMKENRPTATSVGTGRVVSVTEVSAQVGDDPQTRAATGFVNGGLIGMMIASEGGKARIRQYSLRMSDGRTLDVRSFSLAEVGQCVDVVEFSGSTERVLERLEPTACPAVPQENTASSGVDG